MNIHNPSHRIGKNEFQTQVNIPETGNTVDERQTTYRKEKQSTPT